MDQKFGLPSQDYIYDGKHIEFLNVGTQELKEAVIESLKNGETVGLGVMFYKILTGKKATFHLSSSNRVNYLTLTLN